MKAPKAKPKTAIFLLNDGAEILSVFSLLFVSADFLIASIVSRATFCSVEREFLVLVML